MEWLTENWRGLLILLFWIGLLVGGRSIGLWLLMRGVDDDDETETPR